MGKAWPALDVHVPACDPELKELVYAELDDFHPTAIHEPEEPAALRVFFSSAALRDAARRGLGDAFANRLLIQSIDIPDEDWAARSQAQLHAIVVGGLTIAPPWDAAPGSNPIVIQPSTGFGTGHHATTRLMLKALQTLPVEGLRVLDVGCGSGVLALAAERLGARETLGIDVDYDAVSNARENLSLNVTALPIRFEERDLATLTQLWDIVLANLTGALLERSAVTLSNLVAPGGHLIVSGVMATETSVIPTLEERFALVGTDHEQEWLAAVLLKPRT